MVHPSSGYEAIRSCASESRALAKAPILVRSAKKATGLLPALTPVTASSPSSTPVVVESSWTSWAMATIGRWAVSLKPTAWSETRLTS